MLSKWRKQVREGELVGKPPPLEPAAVAELQRLREVEQEFKRLQIEHDLKKKLSSLPQIESGSLRLHRGKPAPCAVKMMCVMCGVLAECYRQWKRGPGWRHLQHFMQDRDECFVQAFLADHLAYAKPGCLGSKRIRDVA